MLSFRNNSSVTIWKHECCEITNNNNNNESLREARLAVDVERVIVASENESESLREARLAADVECRLVRVALAN